MISLGLVPERNRERICNWNSSIVISSGTAHVIRPSYVLRILFGNENRRTLSQTSPSPLLALSVRPPVERWKRWWPTLKSRRIGSYIC